MGRWLLALGALGVARPALADDPLAYVRSSSQHDRDGKGAPYHPIHLLDDTPDTIWCEGTEGLGEGEEVWMFFKRAQKIDRVVVQPAAKTGRLIERITISDGRNTVPIDLSEGAPVEQTFATPMRGEKYTIAIERVGGPNSSAGALGPDVACIGDVMLYFKKAAFGGKAKPESFTYDASKDRVLGAWNGEPLGAPERFITFAIDGTWEWRYDPLMGRGKKKLSGEYRFRTGRLLMRKGDTGRWSDMRFEYRRVDVNAKDPGAPLREYSVLSFNDGLGKELAGEYNDAVF